MTSLVLSEVQQTKKQFLLVITGEYLITGLFWVFITLGSLLLGQKTERAGTTFFGSLFVLMLSNGIWEILTGWYADKFKRQFSMSMGFLACLIGFILMGVAPYCPGSADIVITSKSLVWNAGISIWSLGPALLSGAREAWLVDRCNFFSAKPPEDVSDVFKKAAGWGILAKSFGALCCFGLFLVWNLQFFLAWNVEPNPYQPNNMSFAVAAAIAALLSFVLWSFSRTLKEEYWSHPKYQTNESLLSFMRKALEELWETPYRWFTVSYVGAMSLNYVLSPTVWPYVIETVNKTGVSDISGGSNALVLWGITLIVAELIGSSLSRLIAKWIDLISEERLRMPVASLLYLIPVLVLLSVPHGGFLPMLIAVAFSFRAVNASVFGSLNTLGQRLITSDQRRALLISISSAISSFLMSLVFLLFLLLSLRHDSLGAQIEEFWFYVPVFCIAILVIGGYLVGRRRPATG